MLGCLEPKNFVRFYCVGKFLCQDMWSGLLSCRFWFRVELVSNAVQEKVGIEVLKTSIVICSIKPV